MQRIARLHRQSMGSSSGHDNQSVFALRRGLVLPRHRKSGALRKM